MEVQQSTTKECNAHEKGNRRVSRLSVSGRCSPPVGSFDVLSHLLRSRSWRFMDFHSVDLLLCGVDSHQ